MTGVQTCALPIYAIFSYELLKKAQKTPTSVLLVTKPYMERRAKATFAVQWPDSATQLRVTSPPIDFDRYCNDEQPIETVINIMVGDLDRIMKYPARGLQAEQPIPVAVQQAYETLISAGYTQHLLNTM